MTEPCRSLWTDINRWPFKIDYVDAGGIRTRYIQAGRPDAPPLVMLHGTAGSLENFLSNIGPLSEHFNCHALDMVGCGYTDKPDYDYEIGQYVAHVKAFMDALGIERAGLLGVSIGSWIATRMALTHPERVSMLAMMAPAGIHDLPGTRAKITQVRTTAATQPGWDSIHAIFKRLLHREESVLPDLVATRMNIYQQPGFDKAMAHVLSMMKEGAWERNRITPEEYRSITVPALVVCSVDDQQHEFVTMAREIASIMPNAQLLEMRNVAHWPQFEDPEVFNQALKQFMFEKVCTAGEAA